MISTCKFVLLAVSVSSSVFAVDGVLLLDQNKALAGNVTPGDTPGFPITISQPGSYRLDGNLTVPSQDTTAILVTADNVSIDLNGYTILGPTVCTGTPSTSCIPMGNGNGIDGRTVNGLRISNGTVQGMGNVGLYLKRAYVEKMAVTFSGVNGIVLLDFGTVKDSVVSFNSPGGGGGGGIGANQGGVFTGNIIFGNGGSGLILSGGVATGNTISSSYNTGLSGSGVISGNTVSGSGFNGIFVTCPSSVTGNTSYQNGLLPNSNGVNLVTNGQGCAVANNTP